MPARKPRNSVTSYYSWEGDPCRLHETTTGDTTADVYRGGKGIVPIDSHELVWKAKRIGHADYQELVSEEKALFGHRAIDSRAKAH
jgi:hypothetical protein